MKRVTVGVLAATSMLAFGCTDREPTRPGGPAFLISDAVHNAGKPHFFFLPPMVPTPVPTGTFDAAVSPEVQICRMAGDECEETIVIFTDSTDWGSERVRVSIEDESYIVNWHTDGLNSDATYRIRILAGGVELGFADVDVVDSGRELRNVNTNEYIPLVDGRTLPIKFRVETGFLAQLEVAPEEATVTVGETQQFTATLTDLHGASLALPVTWISSEGAAATVSPSGLATGVTAGSTTISALAAGAEATALLTVVEPEPLAPEPGTVAMTLDPSWTQAVATDVNDAGVVVGYAHPAAGGAGQRRAFRWTGVATDALEVLPSGGATWCEAQGIGNLGTIVGTCGYGVGVGSRGVTWTGSGDPVPLVWPTALGMNSTARGIYESATAMRITGSVTRNYNYTCSFPPCVSYATNAAIWTSTNGAPPTGNPAQLGWNGNVNGASGSGQAVNATGGATGQRSVVVAYSPCFQCFYYLDQPHGFRFTGSGAPGDLGVVYIYPYNTGHSAGLGINAGGTIVGWVDDYSQSNSNATRHLAVRWPAGGIRTGIPGVPSAKVTASEAHDVNDLGWIVGLYAGNAFVWKNGAAPAEVLEPLAPGKAARAHAISDVNDGRMYVAGSGAGADNRTVPVRWTLVAP